jgi:hypothetical protein
MALEDSNPAFILVFSSIPLWPVYTTQSASHKQILSLLPLMSNEWVYGWRGIQGGTLEGEAKQFDVNVEEELMNGTPCCGITLVTLMCLAMMMQSVCLSKMSVTTSQTS